MNSSPSPSDENKNPGHNNVLKSGNTTSSTGETEAIAVVEKQSRTGSSKDEVVSEDKALLTMSYSTAPAAGENWCVPKEESLTDSDTAVLASEELTMPQSPLSQKEDKTSSLLIASSDGLQSDIVSNCENLGESCENDSQSLSGSADVLNETPGNDNSQPQPISHSNLLVDQQQPEQFSPISPGDSGIVEVNCDSSSVERLPSVIQDDETSPRHFMDELSQEESKSESAISHHNDAIIGASLNNETIQTNQNTGISNGEGNVVNEEMKTFTSSLEHSNEKAAEEINDIVNKYIDVVEQNYKSNRDLLKGHQQGESSQGNTDTGESALTDSNQTILEGESQVKSEGINGKFEVKKKVSSATSRKSLHKLPSRKNSKEVDAGGANNSKMNGRKKGSKERRSVHNMKAVSSCKVMGSESTIEAMQEQLQELGKDLSEETRSQISVIMSGIFSGGSQTGIEKLQVDQPDETKVALTPAEKPVSSFVRKYIGIVEQEWRRRRDLWMEETGSDSDRGQKESPYVHGSFVECVAKNKIQFSSDKENSVNEAAEEESNIATTSAITSDPEDSNTKTESQTTDLQVAGEDVPQNLTEECKEVVEGQEKNVSDTVDPIIANEESVPVVEEQASQPQPPPVKQTSWWSKLFFFCDSDDSPTNVETEKPHNETEEKTFPVEDTSAKQEEIDATATSGSESDSVQLNDDEKNVNSAIVTDLSSEESKENSLPETKAENVENVVDESSNGIVGQDEQDVFKTQNAPTLKDDLNNPLTPMDTELVKENPSETVQLHENSAKPEHTILINGRVVVCSSLDQKTRLGLCAQKLNTPQTYAANMKDVSVLPGGKVLRYLNLTDFKNCRLVCKAWNKGIINSKQFLANTTFVIEKKPLGCLATLEASKVPWQNIRCSMLPSMNLSASSTYNGRFMSSNLRSNSRSEPITNTVTTVVFDNMEFNKQQLVQWIQNCRRLTTIIVRNCSVLKSTVSVHMDKANRVMEKVQMMKFSDMSLAKLADILRFFLPATSRLHTLEIIQKKEAQANLNGKTATATAKKGGEEDIDAILPPALKKNRQTLKNIVFEFASTKDHLIQRKFVEALGSEPFQLSSLVVHSYSQGSASKCIQMGPSASESSLVQQLRGTLKNSVDMKYLDFPMLSIDFKKGVDNTMLLPIKLEKLAAQMEIPLQQEHCTSGVVFTELKELELHGISSLDNLQWRHVKKTMPHLTQLDVQTSGLKDSNLQSIIYHLKHLKVMHLRNVADITDFGITGVEVEAIEKLKMSWPEKYDQIPKDKVRFAGKPLSAMTDLHTFSMSGNFNISNVGILFGFSSLTLTALELNGSAVSVSNSGLFILGFQCPNLQCIQMVVQHSKATQAGIQHLCDSLPEKIPSQFKVDLLLSLELQQDANIRMITPH